MYKINNDRISIRIPDEIKEHLAKEAHADKRKLSDYVRKLLLERYEQTSQSELRPAA